MVGPNINNVFGREAGTIEGFQFSSALSNSEIVWDEETLDSFLKSPMEFIPGNSMAFTGFKKEKDRKAVIYFLKTPSLFSNSKK